MKSKKNIKSILIMAAVGIISLFFINMSLAANTGKVSVETANLRKAADENSSILEQFSMNQEVEIIEKQGDWYKVKAKGVTGYLRKDLITVNNEEQIENKTNTSNNQAEQSTTQENVAVNETQATTNQANTVANQTEQNVVNQDNANTTQEKDIELGKQVIGEDTKLKLVPIINATETIEVKKGEEVTVIEVINNWVCIETKNTKGWIIKDKIQKTEQTQGNSTTTKTLYTNSTTVNVRQEPNKSSSIVTKLTNNTAVEVVSEENGWSKVKVSGKEGYILTTLLSDKKQETSRSSTTRKEETTKKQANTTTQANNNATKTQSNATAQTNKQQAKTAAQPATSTPAPTTTAPVASGKGSSVVAAARQYVGCKYVYGGTTPSGFDCSGFTSYVYKKFGVNLSRTAAGQYSNGTAVSRSQLQPGDLVMFGKSGISHVAIYAGGGTIVHAANSKSGVRTDSLNSRYYNKNYVGARRVL